MKYQFIDKKLNKPENISCEFFIVEDKMPDKIKVLVVSFSGVYPDGSLGSNHAKYISKKVISGLIDFDTDALILDFRKFSYSWGNSIVRVFQDIAQFKDAGNPENEPEFPVLILVSDKSKNGITSLLTPSTTNKTPNFIFEDKNLAIEEALKQGKYWLDN